MKSNDFAERGMDFFVRNGRFFVSCVMKTIEVIETAITLWEPVISRDVRCDHILKSTLSVLSNEESAPKKQEKKG